jgi:putative acyl-ACP thioesterase
VKMTDAAKLVQSIATHYSDVDMNGHINSVKYIEHVLNLWPLEWYRHHFLKRFEIAYVAESYCGDTLNFYQEEVGEGEYCIRITKKSKETAEEIEVVRSKVKFIKE